MSHEYPSILIWHRTHDNLKALSGRLGFYLAQTVLLLARRYGDAVVADWSERDHPGPPEEGAYSTIGVSAEAHSLVSSISKRSGKPRTVVMDILVSEHGDDLVERLTAPVEVAS